MRNNLINAFKGKIKDNSKSDLMTSLPQLTCAHGTLTVPLDNILGDDRMGDGATA